MFNYLIFLILASAVVDAAPHKSKYNKKYDGPQMVYDQKQTGDYNIQLHLKDFQIIAMLGDDALGDYDYNYDYADFTVRPSGSTSTTTTPKPTTSTLAPSTTQKEPQSTSQKPQSTSSVSIISPSGLLLPDAQSSIPSEKPSTIISNAHPYPIEVIMPTKNPKKEEDQHPSTEDSQSTSSLEDKNNQNLSSEAALNEISSSQSSSSSESSSIPTANPPSTSSSLLEPSSFSPESPNGKIKVQILEVPSSMGIVPGEDAQGEAGASVLQSELASYRKCSTGYARDKKGRCRRVRRPGVSSQLPFGFSRLASNLATRLRLTPHGNPAETAISTD